MNIYVVGRKYQGKTTLAVYLARTLQREHHGYKILIFEPKWTLRSMRSTNSLEEFEWLLDDAEVREIVYNAGAGKPDATRRDGDQEIVENDFTDFYETVGLEKLLREPPERPLIIVVDEAYYLRNHPLLARMQRLATEGKLYIILCCHRPVEIDPTARGKADVYYFFAENDFNDLRVVEEICGPENAQTVEHLPRHHVLVYRVEDKHAVVWNEPKNWYVDISKPARKDFALV